MSSGGRLISLNHISLEGVTFNEAAEVMQSSPEEVQLIVSQPKGALCACVYVWFLNVCNDSLPATLAFLCLCVQCWLIIYFPLILAKCKY